MGPWKQELKKMAREVDSYLGNELLSPMSSLSICMILSSIWTAIQKTKESPLDRVRDSVKRCSHAMFHTLHLSKWNQCHKVYCSHVSMKWLVKQNMAMNGPCRYSWKYSGSQTTLSLLEPSWVTHLAGKVSLWVKRLCIFLTLGNLHKANTYTCK